MRNDLSRRNCYSRLNFQEGARCLPPLRVWLSNYCSSHDSWVAIKNVFNFHRGNIFTTRDDDVFTTVLHLHIAIGIHYRQITRMKPAALKSLFACLLIFEITLHGNVALEHNLAHRLAIGRNGLEGYGIKNGNRLLQVIANTLPRIEASPLTNLKIIPFILFDTHRCWSIGLR